ncbi:MAG TPA: hypothetical protein VF773_02155 [Verrucomicrobiae bacterium]
MRKHGLPTLDGIVATKWDSKVEKAFGKFANTQKDGLLLVRHDKNPEAPPYPRGGFLVPYQTIREVFEYFIRLGRIVAMYEGADPLANGYNVSALFESPSSVWLEIVGPGFDASDLQRGDASPHEVYSAAVRTDGVVTELKLVQRIASEEYRRAVVERIAKVKRKMDTSPSLELANRIKKVRNIPNEIEVYLAQIKSPLTGFDSYQPIPTALLEKTVTQLSVSRVLERFRESTRANYPMVVASSFVENGNRQVFWDIVSPTLKYQASL